MADESKAAFPRLPVVRDDGEVLEWSQTGMTLREWFAGQVLPVAAGDHAPAKAADLAVRYADALLAALKESAE